MLAEGGSIRDKYDLLWEQQMDRRKALEALGSASGMFKYVVALVAGVPESILDFLKSINDPNGPMEEQRARYGPDLYEITDLGAQLFPPGYVLGRPIAVCLPSRGGMRAV